uniref:Uncharacterized protein n=1 Tax=Nonomuraea gerenzanensis TaxID=93944 RepID=A0A1M4ECN1_9ACTN|nr:hypothetical protein BN4615_P6263 [Nonomuraea gerenzanensis]
MISDRDHVRLPATVAVHAASLLPYTFTALWAFFRLISRSLALCPRTPVR